MLEALTRTLFLAAPLAIYSEYLYIVGNTNIYGAVAMREFRAADLTRNTGDLFEAAALAPVAITKHRKPRFVVMSMQQYEAMTSDHGSQVAVDVADMPDDLGTLLDKGIEGHFHGR